MKSFAMLAVVLSFGFTLAVGDADAASKRFGAGKSTGMQREAATPDKAPTAAATPATAPAAAPTAARAQQPAAAAPQAQPKRSWMGPLAGLAAGLGLAALASHFGFGEELASMLMIGLLVIVVLAVIGFIMRRRAAGKAASGDGALQYAGAGIDRGDAGRSAYEMQMPAAGSSAAAPAAAAAVGAAGNIPADFDVAGFVRNAKLNFIRLQAANDAGNLDDIREFTSPEMFAEIRMNLAERGAATQETDVVDLDAEVVDVVEEDSRYVVSVRFIGQIREGRDHPVEAVDEIWHLTKPRDGRTGWVVAGIQQTQ